jgi:hypothetical protein
MTQSDQYAGEFKIRSSSKDSQRILSEFHEKVSEHLAAIQAAARELLQSPAGVGDSTLSGINIQVGVGPSPNAARFDNTSVDCWDQDVICGRGTNDYIHCTVRVCMEVGPITVEPG